MSPEEEGITFNAFCGIYFYLLRRIDTLILYNYTYLVVVNTNYGPTLVLVCFIMDTSATQDMQILSACIIRQYQNKNKKHVILLEYVSS